ncbi:hypothetical protein ASF11_02420 [Acidovorax sp. Leaf76]|uniref:hypothetical protein n=1 Tax=unclassified Acidovorax TaxID=2684926 RepID=UPI0006F3EB81|nr:MULTISPECIES: hypothetical protein [unclassified Acidovorax]KQO26565.1 hypothetical protein ASF11_02420 [Acidovorax sp. Leaf76]KQO40340.1 hypothetical protein ASF19_01460 [Acidovorax sp. Leaf84]KQS42478.1 hypothetical protein ASG27_01395 [Acidovorax sp. Leaf191]
MTATQHHPLIPRTPLPARLTLVALAGLVAACAPVPPRAPSAAQAVPGQATREAAPTATACPKELAAIAKCLAGQDSAGAYYLIAMPTTWNQRLVLHAHGGPALGAPKPERSVEDLERWSIMVRAGYAWAGSTFRQGGVEVRAAAEDTERLRQIFVQHVAQPQRTILHGQSWGASVAAQGAGMFQRTADGKRPYDAVLLTSGVLAGGTRSYDFRTDLRVVYQYLCHNHPRPTEAAYPLNIGLPRDASMSQNDLQARLNECLGLNKPAAERTAEQQAKVKTIADVIRIPASSIQGHMNWATFHFRDVVQHRTGGASPFGNRGVVYKGSPDDAALNAGVLRYQADPQAVARFGQDTDPTGRIPVPVLTVKGVDDPTAFVELDAQFKATMEQGGSGARLVQTFTRHNTHSYLSDPTYPTLLTALLRWADEGVKPTPESIAQQCPANEAAFGKGCAFLPDYVPAPLASRVYDRTRP